MSTSGDSSANAVNGTISFFWPNRCSHGVIYLIDFTCCTNCHPSGVAIRLCRDLLQCCSRLWKQLQRSS